MIELYLTKTDVFSFSFVNMLNYYTINTYYAVQLHKTMLLNLKMCIIFIRPNIKMKLLIHYLNKRYVSHRNETKVILLLIWREVLLWYFTLIYLRGKPFWIFSNTTDITPSDPSYKPLKELRLLEWLSETKLIKGRQEHATQIMT